MLHAFATCKPSTPGAVFIKPRSALAYPLAIVRVFGRWGVKMPAYKALVAELNGLMRLYLMYHGPYSLMPKAGGTHAVGNGDQDGSLSRSTTG